jgi:tetratricopeptide (TPR) repeat protein
MRFLALILFLIPVFAFAETLPSLKPIDGPNWEGIKTVSDDKFPEYLESQRDYTSAILEWRRVLYRTQDKNIQQRAYLKIANLYTKLKLYKKSLHVYEQFLSNFTQSDQKVFVLEQIHRLSLLTQNQSKADIALDKLDALSKNGNIENAELYALWLLGLEGKDTFFEAKTPKGQTLKSKLETFPVKENKSIQTATLLSFIPGMGYLYLGYTNWAILILMVNVSFFYALINAMNHKHWGYGFAFGSFAAFVYIGSMFYTGTLATEKAYIHRLEAMQMWTSLQPPFVDDFQSFKYSIQPHSLSPNAKPLQTILKN